jgi:serine phosphatase RsbU (regulator of sigma subunit)
MVDAVLEAVQSHTGDSSQVDDMTLVVVKSLG